MLCDASVEVNQDDWNLGRRHRPGGAGGILFPDGSGSSMIPEFGVEKDHAETEFLGEFAVDVIQDAPSRKALRSSMGYGDRGFPSAIPRDAAWSPSSFEELRPCCNLRNEQTREARHKEVRTATKDI